MAKASILCSIHRAVAEDTEPQYGVWNAKKDYELWLALRESADCRNEWVYLPLAEATSLEKRFVEAFARLYGAEPLDSAKLQHADIGRASVLWSESSWL